MPAKEELRTHLEKFDQQHLIDHWDKLSEADQQSLANAIQQVDFAALLACVKDEKNQQLPLWQTDPSLVKPPPAIRLDSDTELNEKAKLVGEQALRDGHVGLLIVAGGQGSRLDFHQPKGLYPIGPVSDRTLFQILFDQVIAVQNRYGCKIPLFVMTSPATDTETRDYFAEQGYLGLSKDQIHVFCQGTMPAFDLSTHRVLMDAPSTLALSPDGHGGMLAAIHSTGGLDLAAKWNLKHFFYCQIDNPLVPICDPSWIGHHLLRESELTTVAVEKQQPGDPVGNVVAVGDSVEIIEYSEFHKLPEEIGGGRDAEERLQLWAGNIAVHVISVQFLLRMVESGQDLPIHLARKKVSYFADGETVKPEKENAFKLERFIFDLLPKAARPLVIECDKASCFAPVKNADAKEGEKEKSDTPSLARAAIVQQHAAWLRKAGVEVGDHQVEINPCLAMDADEVKEKLADRKIESDTYLS